MGVSVYFMKRGKLKLFGFNNLTKTLSFNMYDICYASTEQERKKYIAYIDEQYSAERLTQILNEVADTIGAIVLNTAQQDYDPQGASVTMLIAEEEVESRMWSCIWTRAISLFTHIPKCILRMGSAHSAQTSMYRPAGKSLL